MKAEYQSFREALLAVYTAAKAFDAAIKKANPDARGSHVADSVIVDVMDTAADSLESLEYAAWHMGLDDDGCETSDEED